MLAPRATLCAALVVVAAAARAGLANIVMILTDDQDVEMGSSSRDVMPQLHALIADAGATFSRSYAAVPICCPSRASLFSGRYQHNTKVLGNNVDVNCSSHAWQATVEPDGVASHLRTGGSKGSYTTFFAGKYMNMYGYNATGGVQHVPAGWDDWHGLVGNSVYYSYTMSNNGVAEAHGRTPADYLPSVILNRSLTFMAKNAGKPKFMVLSTPACHGPQEAETRYQGLYPDAHAPRTPAFNASVTGAPAHWIQQDKAVYGLDDNSAAFADLVMRRRLQTLATVDDIIVAVVAQLEAQGELDNTYIFYTSGTLTVAPGSSQCGRRYLNLPRVQIPHTADNGYHLGHFGFIYDKRQPWETDTHIPLYVRGPGIRPNSTCDALTSNVDLATTFLDIGFAWPPPATYDGSSLMSCAAFDSSQALWATAADAASPAASGSRSLQATKRRSALVEYHGEGGDGGEGSPVCSLTAGQDLFGGRDGNYTLPPFWYGRNVCVIQDAPNNTYSCLRYHDDTVTPADDFRYCEFADALSTVEFFNYTADPFELHNAADEIPAQLRGALHSMLGTATQCVGTDACNAALQVSIR